MQQSHFKNLQKESIFFFLREMALHTSRMANIFKLNSKRQVVKFKRKTEISGEREFKAMGTGRDPGSFQ